MKGSFLGLVVATLLVTLGAFLLDGFELVWQGLLAARETFLQALPLLIIAFVVTGQIQVLLSREWIDRLWEKVSGVRGIFLSAIAGGFFPGPPYVYYPFFATFKGKKIPSYLFFSFIAGKQIYDFTRLPMEISLISPAIALYRNLITIPIPFLMGLVFRRFVSRETTARFFGEGGS